MNQPDTAIPRETPWISLWVVAFLSFVAQLALCQFFSFGQVVPMSIDMNPSNLWLLAYDFPPTGTYQVLNWFGFAHPPYALNPFSLAAAVFPSWLFFTAYAPLMGLCSLLAMAAFLRELELPRPAALFGGVVFAWQGDLLPFIFPGHFAYITSWPFFAVAAWGALRAQRTGYWAYAIISGAGCGMMVELPTTTDRGAIASLLIAAFYLAPVVCHRPGSNVAVQLRNLALCAGTALLISLASFLSLFQSQIVGVKMGGMSQREQTYKLCTQFSLGPQETLTYLVPGFFGWHTNDTEGPYWGTIGQWPGWENRHQGSRNLNLAISTTGTVATVLALIGAFSLLSGGLLGPARMSERTRFYGRVLLLLGALALVLSWGHNTPFYRPLFALPLMDKWRNPLKWLEITNFALITLGAFGVQHLLCSLASGTPEAKIIRRRLAWFCGIVLGLLLVGLLASYPYAIVLAAKLQTYSYEPGAIASIMATLHHSLIVAVLIMVLFCLVLFGLWYPEFLRSWTLINPMLHRLWQNMLQPAHLPLTLACGLALLSIIQLGWVATKFIEPVNLSTITATNGLLDALKQEGDRVRVSVATEDPVLNVMLLNQFSVAKISSVDISAASRIPDDLNAFFNAMNGDRQRLWFLAGVKNVALPQQFMSQLRLDPNVAANIDHADGYTLIPTQGDEPSHALIGMRDYLAKATFVPSAEMIASEEGLLKRLDDRSWNPRQTVLLNPAQKRTAPVNMDDAKIKPSPQDAVDLLTYTPTEIKIDVQSIKGGYVLINDQYDPDWKVQVNGRDADLLRANYIMRAVEVPPGESTITMHYATHYHVAGFNIPAGPMNLFSDTFMLAAWLIAALALLRRKNSFL